MRHEIEERQSRSLRREEEGHGRKGDLRIDLESGFVTIAAPPARPDAADHTEPDDNSDHASARRSADRPAPAGAPQAGTGSATGKNSADRR